MIPRGGIDRGVRPLVTTAFCCLLGLSVAGTARGQESTALAVAQFDRGLKAMEQGRLDEACPALAESQRLDPRPGTLFTLAECEAKWGKLASALGHYNVYLERFARMSPDQQAGQRGRQNIAEQRRQDLEKRTPHLSLSIKDGRRDVTIQLDSTELGVASLSLPIPVDPGHHVIKVTNGSAVESNEIDVKEGQRLDVELRVPEAPPAAAQPPPSDGAAPVTKAPTSSRRTVGWILTGVGGAGLVVGGIAGALAVGHASDVDAHCVGHACDPTGLDAVDATKSTGLVSTIGIIAGAALLVGGVVLVLTAPKASRVGSLPSTTLVW